MVVLTSGLKRCILIGCFDIRLRRGYDIVFYVGYFWRPVLDVVFILVISTSSFWHCVLVETMSWGEFNVNMTSLRHQLPLGLSDGPLKRTWKKALKEDYFTNGMCLLGVKVNLIMYVIWKTKREFTHCDLICLILPFLP